MLFNSYVFIFALLPITLLGYYVLNHFHKFTVSKIWVILASLIFYGYFTPQYCLIILGSIIVNYCFHYILTNPHASKNSVYRKTIFIAGIFCNLGLLFYFKYFNFFLDNINTIFRTSIQYHKILLPLGISFFTFQQLSVIIDSYTGKTSLYNPIDYALYIAFFPQLVAGPIVLHEELIPQFQDPAKKVFNPESFMHGVRYFSIGLAKKVLIADILGQAVQVGFDNYRGLNSFSALFVMLSYTLQIYFDFSGYSDMARGIGYMFNVTLPINFDSPYKAKNIDDFWKRWHITLTRFFTTYLYIPLGGNRKGKIRTYCNVLIVFLVSGLWHGANWTFILWGFLHGIASVIYRMFKKFFDRLPAFLTGCMTFVFVNIAWVIFRSDSILESKYFLGHLLKGGAGLLLPEIQSVFPVNAYLFLLVGLLLTFFAKNTHEIVHQTRVRALSVIMDVLLLTLSIISLSQISTFLYYNF